tara:strand:- start:3241 stop:3519 length:279 start_codon:yes stop_codon:yes gene_type:complete
MCIGPFAPKAPKMLALPDLSASNRAATDNVGELPAARQTKSATDVASVSYGTNKKQSGPAAGKKTGTAALTIDKQLNTGNINQGSNTTGLNV